jgi:hypothetical protein
VTAPRRPAWEIVPGTPSHRLIRGVLQARVEPSHVQRVVLHRAPAWTISLVDSGDGHRIPRSGNEGGDVTLQLLWSHDEDAASVTVEGTRYPIAPGDTMSVPGGREVRLAAGMLLVEVEASSRRLEAVLPPSHGVESFEGYNRRTDYDTPATFSLQRWKITQHLTFPASNGPFAIVDLAAPLALLWSGGTDLIGRGECRVIDPETGAITLLPDGLGYALVVR